MNAPDLWADKPVIEGKGGASGQGWSELKDIECSQRYAYIKRAQQSASDGGTVTELREPTKQEEAYAAGGWVHAARAKWFVLGQSMDKTVIEQCYQAGRDDAIAQGWKLEEFNQIEYQLMFYQFAMYNAIRAKPRPYAVELYVEYDWATVWSKHVANGVTRAIDGLKRTTRYDDVSYYPDNGYCIGEFKTTKELTGALKFYNDHNPQILLQQLIYLRSNTRGEHPPINGTTVDIWDKFKCKGTRHFIPINEDRLAKYETWLIKTLKFRDELLYSANVNPERNYMVCNTFNDAYNSQCPFKERCDKDT